MLQNLCAPTIENRLCHKKIRPSLEVVEVSTRGAVLFEASDRFYEAYYNHCDSHPTWLGVRLAELLKRGRTAA